SASRIIKRLWNGVPPQYIASYLAKYHGQLGMFTFWFLKSPMISGGGAGLGANAVTPPQSSKTMFRTLSGVLLSMVAILGRPFGVGKGLAGKFMFFVAPETTMVASVIGYENITAGSHNLSPLGVTDG